MSQPRLSASLVQTLLTVGPFLGIDATTSSFYVDAYHASDSIGVVPNRAFQGYVTAKGRVHALAVAYLSKLYGLTKFLRVGNADLYVAAVNNGSVGALQTSQLGGTPTTLALPTGSTLTASRETSFAPYQQWLFETNGADTPLKIDTNLAVTQWQIAPPTTAAAQTFDPGPNNPGWTLVNGTSDGNQVFFCYTQVTTQGHESNVSTVESDTPSTTQQVQIMVAGNGQPDVIGINVYAAENANGPFYKQNATPLAVTNGELANPYTIPSPLVTSGTLSPVTTYNLVGQYYYFVTFANASQESSPSPVSPGIIINTNASDGSPAGFSVLTNIPISTDPQVTARNVYRFGGSMQQIQLVGTINDNTSTVFTDNLADLNVIGQTLIQHRDVPQPFYAIEMHKGRAWGFGYSGTAVGEPATIAGTSDLWYSNYEEPWGFNNVTQVIPIGRNAGGDIAVEVKSLGSVLYCLKSRSFWAVYGDTPQDFVQRRLFDCGCASKRSVVRAYGRLFWMSDSGSIVMFDGANLTNISDNRTTGANSSIKAILDGFTTNDYAACTSAAHDQLLLFSFPTQNITFAYDLPSGQWYKLPWAFDRAVFDLENQNELQAAEVGTGVLDTWFASETDLGSAITSSYVSRITDGGDAAATKRLRYASLLAPIQPGADATLTTTVNPGTGQVTNTRTIDLGSSPPMHTLSLPPTMHGTEMQITLAVTSTVKTEIHRVALYGWVERRFVRQG